MAWRFLPFEEARKYAHSLKLKSSKEWFAFCKSKDFPNNVPKRPAKTYANDGWDGFSDWLGTGHGKYLLEGKGRLSFEEAREFVRKLNIPGLNGWIAYCKSGKRPANIPASAHTAYKDKWQGYGDWTGTGRKRHTKFLPFKEAREFARSLNLFTQQSWDKFTKSNERPKNIPAVPDQTYKKEWTGWKDWLRKTDKILTEHLVSVEDTEVTDAIDSAIGNLKQKCLSYTKAREFVRKLGLKGQKEWFAYAKSNEKPENIPGAPYNVYDEWTGFSDWLGTTRIRPTSFLPFEEAREFVRKLDLKGQEEWEKFVTSGKKPIGIPAQPDAYYVRTNEWTNWYDWLGKTRGKSGEGAAVRRIISRFEELEKLELSVEDIMNKLSNEFPEKSQSDIKQILLKWAETHSD